MSKQDIIEGGKIVAAGACHHINNILAIIIGNAEMVAMTQNEEDRIRYINSMLKGIKRLKKTMAKFKTVSIGDMEDLPVVEGTGILDITNIKETIEG